MVVLNRWHASNYIRTERDAGEYLRAVAELDDAILMRAVLCEVRKAQGRWSFCSEPAPWD